MSALVRLPVLLLLLLLCILNSVCGSENAAVNGVNFQSWISEKPNNASQRMFKSRSVYDSLVSAKEVDLCVHLCVVFGVVL